MSQGTVYQNRQQLGQNTTSSDYHDYISKLSKMPTVIHGAPQYPSVHKAFNKKVIQEEEVTEVRQDKAKKKKNPTKSPKKVHIMEQVQFIEENGNQNSEVIEESVDETDNFIEQKRKGFELCKWKTFKFP